MRKLQISVIGYDKDCTQAGKNAAYEVGREIARVGAVLVCGGLGGVMESACMGARENGGMTVGIIPQEEFSYANEYCDIVVCTGIGHARDFLVAFSSDGIIVIGGGVGSLIELAAGYLSRKVIVSIENSGGVAKRYEGEYLDERKLVQVMVAKNARIAVDLIVAANKKN